MNPHRKRRRLCQPLPAGRFRGSFNLVIHVSSPYCYISAQPEHTPDLINDFERPSLSGTSLKALLAAVPPDGIELDRDSGIGRDTDL
jgi:hypothetical protein